MGLPVETLSASDQILARDGLGATRAATLPSAGAYFDDFDRPDTAYGDLGLPPIGGAYDLRTASAVSASVGKIENGRVVSQEGQTLYAIQTLPSDCNEIEAVNSWLAGSGSAGDYSTFALLIGAQNAGADLYENLALHFTVRRDTWLLQYVVAGTTPSPFVTVARGNFPTLLSLDTPYRFKFTIDGQIVRYEIAGVLGETKPVQGFVTGKLGRYATFEHYYEGNVAKGDRPCTHMCRAGYALARNTSLGQRMLAQWRMHNTNWRDAVQGRTLTPGGSPTVAPGRFGNAALLRRASNQFLARASDSDLLLNGKSWTVVVLFKPTAADAGVAEFQFLISKGVEWGMYLDCLNSQVRFGASSTAAFDATKNALAGSYNPNGWNFAVLRYSASEQKLYGSVNGGFENSFTIASIYEGSGALQIGLATGWPGAFGTPYFNGLIDEVTIYATAPGHGGSLNDYEIATLYDDGGSVPISTKTITADADVTLLASDGRTIFHTGTLTAARDMVLPAIGVIEGDRFTVTRSGSGAFNITVKNGASALKALASGTWADFHYTGTAWMLARYGAL